MKVIPLPSGKELRIRLGKGSDAQAFVDFLHQIAGESDNLTFGPNEITVKPDEQVETIQKMNDAPNQLFLVAEVEGTMVGNLTFRGGARPRTQHAGEFGVSVLKEYWGFGIGRALIEFLLDWAKDSTVIRKINLRVRSDNESAIHLYKKLGFNEEGAFTREFLIEGVFYDCILMGIDID